MRLQLLFCSEPVCTFGVLQMVFNKQLRHVQKGCLVLMNNKLFEDHQQWCGSCSDAKLCWFISCAQTLFAIGLRNAGNVEKRCVRVCLRPCVSGRCVGIARHSDVLVDVASCNHRLSKTLVAPSTRLPPLACRQVYHGAMVVESCLG